MEDASAAFGKGITANKTESLALSGTEYAKDFRINDARLVQDEKTIDPATMLRDMKKLQVVSHAPYNLCRHQGRDPADCARDRSVGLRSLPAGAVSSGTALTLAVRGGRVIEQVDDVQSLDVGALPRARCWHGSWAPCKRSQRSSTPRTLRSRCSPSKTRSWVTASRRSRWWRRSSENVGKNHNQVC